MEVRLRPRGAPGYKAVPPRAIAVGLIARGARFDMLERRGRLANTRVVVDDAGLEVPPRRPGPTNPTLLVRQEEPT